MASVFSLAIVSSIVLLSLYLAYKLFLAPLKQPVVNRFTILAMYAGSVLAWPLSQNLSSAGGSGVEIPFDISLDNVTAEILASPTMASSFTDILLLVYCIGVVLVTILVTWSLTNLLVELQRSPKVDIDGVRVCVIERLRVSPFSLFGYIAINRADLSDARLILAHETCHQRKMHSADLVVAQLMAAFQWFNPAAWLMMRELKAVHEYDVDESLIAKGINLKEYQYLLIKKAVGARFPSLANSLNHSNLKKRITMMQKSKDAGARRWRVLALVPVLVVALGVTHLHGVASVIDAAASSRLPQLTDGKVSDNSATAQEEEITTMVLPAPEEMPKFPGGEQALMMWVADHMVYPQEAMDNNEQGRVVVKFIVNKNGQVESPSIVKSVSPLLDAEALRVVSLLPLFEPGKLKGEPVSVSYVIPMQFSLKADAKPGSKNRAKSDVTTIKDGNVTVYVDGKQVDKAKLMQINGSDVKSMEIIKGGSESGGDKVSAVTNPTLFVDGEAKPYEQLNEIKPADIKSIQVIKNDANYPQGKILITLK